MAETRSKPWTVSCRHWPRVNTIRVGFYSLLLVSAAAILYYKSLLATVSVQITFNTMVSSEIEQMQYQQQKRRQQEQAEYLRMHSKDSDNKMPSYDNGYSTIKNGLSDKMQNNAEHSDQAVHLGDNVYETKKSIQQGIKKMKNNTENSDELVTSKGCVYEPIKPGQSAKWQRITENGDQVVYAAYYNKHQQYGHVIQAIILKAKLNIKRQGDEDSRLRCMLLYESDKPGYYQAETISSTNFFLWDGHHHKRYRPGHICCQLPDKRFPKAVAITIGSTQPFNQVTVHYDQLQHQSRTVTLCLSPLHFTTNVAKKLVNYFEMNRILGADYFYVYDFHVPLPVKNVLAYYGKRNDTKIVKWKLPPYLKEEDDVWYYAQTVALNDCFLRSKGNTQYMITTDLDEFIFPKGSFYSWNELLKKEPYSCSYNFECIVIDVAKQVSVITNENRKRISEKFDLFTLLHQMRNAFVNKAKVKSKAIVRPKCYDGVNVHGPMISVHNETVYRIVNSDHGAMYHYASPDAKFIQTGPSRDSDIDKSAMRFAAQLIKNAASAWKQIDKSK